MVVHLIDLGGDMAITSSLKIENDKWNEELKKFYKTDNTVLKVGLWGEGSSASDNIAYRGYIHEYGVTKQNIPERSFMRKTLEIDGDRFTRFIARKLKEGYDENSVDEKWTEIGKYHQDRIQETIRRQIGFEPLKPETIKRKGSSLALIDTANMLNSITFRVEK